MSNALETTHIVPPLQAEPMGNEQEASGQYRRLRVLADFRKRVAKVAER